MIPAILQTDWTNQVAFKPGQAAHHVESFFIKANDPRHKHAVWLRLGLVGRGSKEQYGESQAIFFDGETGQHRTAEERWPIQRVQVDCERAGVGIGESNVQAAATTGVVRGNDFSISWDMHLSDKAEGYCGLPADWLYKGKFAADHKVTTPHPAGTFDGQLEIWHHLKRHTPATHLDVRGWHGMQGHRWGSIVPDHTAWVHCNAFEGEDAGAYFEAFAAPFKVAKVLNGDALIGRLHLGGQVYNFTHWRNVFGKPGQFSPTRWAFELTGPEGTVSGKVTADPKGSVAVVGAGTNTHRFHNAFAQLHLEVKPHSGGPARTLVSQMAGFEVVQPAPRGAAANSAPAQAA